jgi:hypothetical protein
VADGASVLLSSHEPELSVPLSDRVATMTGGRVTGEEPGGRRSTLAAVPVPAVIPPAEPAPAVSGVSPPAVPAVESVTAPGTMGAWHVA